MVHIVGSMGSCCSVFYLMLNLNQNAFQDLNPKNSVLSFYVFVYFICTLVLCSLAHPCCLSLLSFSLLSLVHKFNSHIFALPLLQHHCCCFCLYKYSLLSTTSLASIISPFPSYSKLDNFTVHGLFYICKTMKRFNPI